MKPEQQLIAIAQVLGWTACGCVEGCKPHGYPPDARKPTTAELLDGTGPMPWDIPDFLNDLNEMWLAVRKGLTGAEQLRAYESELMNLSPDYPTEAIASQRAEAFLRALNLWDEC
jgi:hypothetical protein